MQKPGFNVALLQVSTLDMEGSNDVFWVAVFNRIDTVTHVAHLNEKDSFCIIYCKYAS